MYKSGSTEFDAVDDALSWLTVVDETPDCAPAAAELQDVLQRGGETLAARDAFIAGTAIALDEPLAVSDSDFEAVRRVDALDVDLL